MKKDRNEMNLELSNSSILCSFERKNKYTIFSPEMKPLYNAIENTDCCTRNCCGKIRPFDLNITDPSSDDPIIHLYRPLRCDSYCCVPCCPQVLEVNSPPGTLIGRIVQECSFWHPRLTVRKPDDDVLFVLKGPFVCHCRCCSDLDYQLLTADEDTKLGSITKKWRGCCSEAFTDSDNFRIDFPVGLTANTKALLIGAAFLVDFMFHENTR
ncbi:hypothetical protein Anas_06747 [Armadillidium nasatum]|uniref:Phospholipid scramblase n=1 Tax=Armadillidium nasatum TaxID=96803 RepID=A0A5N5SWW5_9CRUS|nr:hypothetical protein Anas_06747 [Armadillidium nasatum]